MNKFIKFLKVDAWFQLAGFVTFMIYGWYYYFTHGSYRMLVFAFAALIGYVLRLLWIQTLERKKGTQSLKS